MRLYRFALRLLPRDFRRSYGAEMQDVFAQRVASAPLRVVCAEIFDVVITAIRLRFERSPDPRPALVAIATLTLVVGVAVHERNAWFAPRLMAQADSIDFQATDPAGEFTLAIRRGRPVAATIDRVPLPAARLVHTGDSIRFLAPAGGVVLAVAYYRDAARIEWEARSQACRGQAATCVRYQ